MVLYSGEPQGGFCNVGCVHCCFCDLGCCSSLIAFWRELSPFRELLQAFYTHLYFQPSSLQGRIRGTLILTFPVPSFIVSPRALLFWVGIFYPQAFFTLRSFPTFLPQPAFIKVSLRGGNSSLKFAWIHADPRNTDPAHLFVWFTAIRNLDIQKNSYLNGTKYYDKLLVVKSLVVCSFCLFKVICKDRINHFEQVLYFL